MKWVGILPYVYKPFFDQCINTMAKSFRDNVLIVDNTKNNIGIMKSHNVGVDFMYQHEAEWLVVLSASIRFFEHGGLDFIELLGKNDCKIINGAGEWTRDGLVRIEALGFHLTAFHRSVFDKIGNWDENFSNYSLDDTDLNIRILKGYPEAKRDSFPVAMKHETTAHSINLGHIKGTAYAPRNSYLTRKWGRDGGDWQNPGFDTPFNNPELPLSYWPKPDEPLSIWQNEYKQGYNFDD